MESRAPQAVAELETCKVISQSNEHDKTFENMESKMNYTNEGNYEEKENEKENMETDGRWYSPEVDKEQDDDIYSDEIIGVEPIIKKEDKWKHAFVLQKTPQHK
eukprot:385666_1